MPIEIPRVSQGVLKDHGGQNPMDLSKVFSPIIVATNHPLSCVYHAFVAFVALERQVVFSEAAMCSPSLSGQALSPETKTDCEEMSSEQIATLV